MNLYVGPSDEALVLTSFARGLQLSRLSGGRCDAWLQDFRELLAPFSQPGL